MVFLFGFRGKDMVFKNKHLEDWLKIDPLSLNELKEIEKDEWEIRDRFEGRLTFGTAGIRGKTGAGWNRMNRHTVCRATQAFANYLNCGKSGLTSVVIAYDSRNHSKLFAEETAAVFAGNGFQVYLYDSVRTTPELSFAVRRLGADGGVMITASHNPPEYNGYKVYGSDGCQLLPEETDRIAREYESMEKINYIPITHCIDTEIVKYVPVSVDHDYMELVKGISLRPSIFKDTLVKAVFTPLHGTGGAAVRGLFDQIGYEAAIFVGSQMEPNGDFPTAPNPNPESIDAYAEAKREMRHQGGDLILATDPDCDRMGMMLKTGKLLTGNQVAALFLDYILSFRREHGMLRDTDYIVTSVVSGDLPRRVAESYGVSCKEVLTGFKYIGKEIENDPEGFIMGFEESCGYLFSPEIRDKDGVMATLLGLEMAIYKNKNLEHVLRKLHRLHGTYVDTTESLVLENLNGVMARIRERGAEGATRTDFLLEETGLPKTNLVKFLFADGSWVAFRPSGTEPKLKVYYSAKAPLQKQAEERLEELKRSVHNLMRDDII